MIYDPTSGMIETPDGMGRFLEYDGENGVVAVEMDDRHIVFYPGESCFVKGV